MNFLPIVHRELRIAARKRGTYISRSVVAGIVLLLWLTLSSTTGQHMSPAELSRTLFWTYGILSMLYALLCGVFFTADALSAERREGTLGLLFLTDLKGFDVVLGKLVATSWHGVYSLLVIGPVLTLPLLMGGVSHTEMGRFVALILSTTFYSLALGLLISTVCRRLVVAVAITFLLLFLQCTMPWLFAWVLDEVTPLGVEDIPLVLLCPFTSMTFLMDVSYRSGSIGGLIGNGAVGFWLPIWMMIILGAGFLGSACWFLPRVWKRDEQPLRKTDKPKVPMPGSAQGNREEGSNVQPHCIEGNPYRWLALRDRKLNRFFAGVLLALTAMWSVFFCLSFVRRLDDMGFSVALFGAFALHVLTKGWLALESSRRYCEDRQSGAMELLMVTPIPVREVIQGEVDALKRVFGFPLVLLTSLTIVFALAIARFNPVHLGEERWWFAEVALLGAVVLWLDARAIVYTGLLTGLKSRRHHRAVLGTIFRVLVPPWTGVAFFFLFIMLPGGVNRGEFLFSMHAWFLLCAFLDIALAGYAKGMLRQHLRTLCAGDLAVYGIPEDPVPADRVSEEP